MKLELLSLVSRLDCLSCVLTVFSTILVGKKMLGGLGAGGGEQPDHLRHRVKNGATGLHSGEPVLYCALCLQPPNLAQGRALLTSVPEDAAAEIKYLESHGYPIACVEMG
jgi:hypothetical protein